MKTEVTVRSYPIIFLAEMAQNYLLDNGISSEILPNNTFAGVFAVELRVFDHDLLRAEHLLEEFENQENEHTTGNNGDCD